MNLIHHLNLLDLRPKKLGLPCRSHSSSFEVEPIDFGGHSNRKCIDHQSAVNLLIWPKHIFFWECALIGGEGCFYWNQPNISEHFEADSRLIYLLLTRYDSVRHPKTGGEFHRKYYGLFVASSDKIR